MNSVANSKSDNVDVLIVDDEEDIRALFSSKLSNHGFRVDQASNIKDALAACNSRSYSAILLDLFLGDENSLESVCEFLSANPETKIIILTGYGSIDFAVNAMNKGATGFLVKTDQPEVNVEKFKELLLKHDLDSPTVKENLESLGIIGRSSAVLKIAEKLKRLKDVDSTVLLQGESGTGKELFARAIHKTSSRSSGPFIAINCAAISENILESELFGYKRGAFTDAKTDRKGYFETCSNGTLFLDEIGEMSLGLQSKLLRVLQEKEVTPLGSCHPIAVNTRILVATNRNLKEDIRSKGFREDLYYRVAVFEIELPPLRMRKDDIPALVDYFVKRFNDKFGKNVLSPTTGLFAKIKAYNWPGNIRELQNSIERAVVLANNNELNLDELLPHSNKRSYATEESESPNLNELPLNFQQAKEAFESFYVKNLLSSTHGNVTEAAKLSGQYRPNVYRLIRKYDLNTQQYKNKSL